jgi:hypothetical protein
MPASAANRSAQLELRIGHFHFGPVAFDPAHNVLKLGLQVAGIVANRHDRDPRRLPHVLVLYLSRRHVEFSVKPGN